MERLMLRCPHCGGTYMVDGDGNKCVTCSMVVKSLGDRRRYYLFNKQAILDAVKQLGEPKTGIKLKIPKTTLYGLIRRWSKNGTPAPAPAASTNNVLVLPPLPAWSDTWDPTVQLAWLKIFNYLVNGKGPKEVTNAKEHTAAG